MSHQNVDSVRHGAFRVSQPAVQQILTPPPPQLVSCNVISLYLSLYALVFLTNPLPSKSHFMSQISWNSVGMIDRQFYNIVIVYTEIIWRLLVSDAVREYTGWTIVTETDCGSTWMPNVRQHTRLWILRWPIPGMSNRIVWFRGTHFSVEPGELLFCPNSWIVSYVVNLLKIFKDPGNCLGNTFVLLFVSPYVKKKYISFTDTKHCSCIL